MENQNTFVKSLLDELQDTSRYLTEDFIFNNQPQEMHQDEPSLDDGATYQSDDENAPQSQQMPQNGDLQHDDNAEQKAMHAHEIIQHEPIIQKIRETAIDGLKKYAEDPTSSIYEFFKKVFLESDKVLTDDGSSNK